jgi:cobalt-zinc-cadmium efflux system outer membrane protein
MPLIDTGALEAPPRGVLPALFQRFGLLALAILAGAVADAPRTFGAEPTAAAPLSFAAAARRTLNSSPQLRGSAFGLDAARARESAAAFRPPVELGASLENALGTGSVRGTRESEFTLSLTTLFERGGKRDARVATAVADTARLSVEQRVLALDLVAETGRRFVAVAAAQERRRLAERALAQAETTVKLVEPRVAAARSPRTELLYARIDREQAAVRLAAAERELTAARTALAALWGTPDERPEVDLALFDLPGPAALDELRARLASLPDLERYASQARLRDAELRLATAQSVTDVRWQLGVRHLQAPRDQALIAGLSLPFGQRARAEPGIREAQANRARVDLEADAARFALESTLVGEHVRLLNARAALDAVTVRELPLAREARELTERAYRIGRFPYRELAIAQQQVIALDAARVDAAVLFHLTRIEVERLSGAQLDLLEE